jgi:hypothetical protein
MIKLFLRASTIFCVVAATLTSHAQIDPAPRQLLHLGFDQSLKTDGPMGAYAFYYWNQPNVPTTNQFLRLAIAPVYLDGEWGFKGLLGENTDLGIGFFGGMYANSYNEIRGGNYVRDESFEGNGVGGSVSLYHLFNPAGMIPLSGVLRGVVDYNNFNSTDDTAPNFVRPDNQPIYTLRTGLRFGGKEPVLGPTLAMELSGWYEMEYRPKSGGYGFANDRELESVSHRIFGRAQINYTTLDRKHYIVLGLQGGTVLNPDRLSAYRLGGMLPYTSEFPLIIPGYFQGELSAKDYGLLNGLYAWRIGDSEWKILAMGAAAVVKYTDGMGQSGAFNSGVGTGLAWSSKNRRWKIANVFGYGINARRDDHEGGVSAAVAFQYNFGPTTMASDEAFEQLQQAHTATR